MVILLTNLTEGVGSPIGKLPLGFGSAHFLFKRSLGDELFTSFFFLGFPDVTFASIDPSKKLELVLVVNTLDRRNPKQPPGNYKTLYIMGITHILTGAGFLPCNNTIFHWLLGDIHTCQVQSWHMQRNSPMRFCSLSCQIQKLELPALAYIICDR